MFLDHDIGPHVDSAVITRNQHVYALGPVAGLQGEITVLDGQVFVSKAAGSKPAVTLDPKIKSVFLVYASVFSDANQPQPTRARAGQRAAACCAHRRISPGPAGRSVS